VKTILCAIDYAENSVAALNYAYTMSAKMENRLFVTYILDFQTISGNEGLD